MPSAYWDQTSFDAKCRGSSLGVLINITTLFVVPDGLSDNEPHQSQRQSLWRHEQTLEADRPECLEQRKKDSMPCIIWVCRVLLCWARVVRVGPARVWSRMRLDLSRVTHLTREWDCFSWNYFHGSLKCNLLSISVNIYEFVTRN